MQSPRLLFVHAHPDDESLNNGATIAHYTAKGAQVKVVTCTLGEDGEVIGQRWAHLAVDEADQLGGYRIGELTAALRELGIGEPIFLGGAGRWRDSGMAGAGGQHRRRFVDADDREAVGALVEIIREFRPHVVVTYDPKGGYGHPDHIHAHEVTTAAIQASGTSEYPGTPWQVPKFYWTVTSSRAFAQGLAALDADELPKRTTKMPFDDGEATELGYSEDDINAVVDAPEALAAKVAALTAHATQVTVAPSGRACFLSNNFALPILAAEHYVLASGVGGDRDERGWETSLLAGLDLD